MIRLARNEDVDSIYNLICILEDKKFDFDEFYAIFQRVLDDENHVFLVYEEENIVKGLCHFTTYYHMHHCAKVADILELVVLEEERSGGIGHQLIKKAQELAKNAGCVEIELDTNQRRKDAHRFYEREGFKNDHYNFTMKL